MGLSRPCGPSTALPTSPGSEGLAWAGEGYEAGTHLSASPGELTMRISVGILASAAVLFASGAAGLLGTWSLVAATVFGLVGAVATVIVMEERDHAEVVADALADRRRPRLVEPAVDASLDLLGH